MENFTQICESIMLICFGLSWPISVYKSITAKSTKGKSILFLSAILLGYLAGILGKCVSGNITYVLILYVINFCIVSTDFVIYFINKKYEKQTESNAILLENITRKG